MSPPPGARPRRTPTSRKPRAVIAGASTALILAASFVAATNAGASAPPPPSGWSTVWTDDFDGPANSLPSGAN
jgi:hypothetical protein